MFLVSRTRTAFKLHGDAAIEHQRATAHDESNAPSQDSEKIDVTTPSFAQCQNNAEIVTNEQMSLRPVLWVSHDVFDGTV